MKVRALAAEISAGSIVGISAVIYSISYGALLFSGPLSVFVGYAIAITLITAVAGALFGWLGDGKTFIGGPDSNTTSVLATMLAVIGAAGLPPETTLHLAVATVFLTTLVAAIIFYAIARANLAGLARYIPFAVMAGFLTSTGWMMVSGALNIIAGTPLTWAGVSAFLADPVHPELVAGFVVAGLLFALARRVPGALLIPLVIFAACVVINAIIASPWCQSAVCSRDVWMFADMRALPWLAPWKLNFGIEELDYLVNALPGMLVVSFVGLLTVLLSIASLELTHLREFDLNTVLRAHALTAGVSAGVGGFAPIISIGRTSLNRQMGGGRLAGLVAAAICLATLLGAAGVIAYIPKAALGGLILFLGLGLIKQWLLDQVRAVTRLELCQILLILALVVSFGFVVGFAAGMLIASLVFVFTYSRIPLADLVTNLSVFASTVMRPAHETATLEQHGHNTLIYRLSGYMFFGSARKIETVFRHMDDKVEGVVLDFTHVSGVDRSAVGVFQRILRRYQSAPLHFYIVTGPANTVSLRAASAGLASQERVLYFDSLDHAVEAAEQAVIGKWNEGGDIRFALFDDADDNAVFLACCALRRVNRGEALCVEGDKSDQIFFVQSGSLEVTKRNGRRLAKLNAGAVVGEQAFYTGGARTASIVAVSDAQVYVLDKKALNSLRAANPGLATRFDHIIIHKIAHALARTSALLAMYR